jgi:hypothetical protein
MTSDKAGAGTPAPHRRMWGNRRGARAAARYAFSAVLFAVLLIPAVPAFSKNVEQSAARTEASAHRLRGVTTFRGSRPGSALVHLPKPVDITSDDEADDDLPYDFRGNGRVIALLMTQYDDETALGDGASLLAWSYGRCLKKGCKARGFLLNNVVAFGPLEEKNGENYLPEGDYRAFYVADGARTRFRMELTGLRGKTTIRPRGEITSALKTLRPKSESAADSHTYWGGRSTDLTGRGLSLLGFWMVGEEDAARAEAGFCVYNERPENQLSYMPPCPLADDSGASPTAAESIEFSRYNGESLMIEQGLGAHYTTPSELEKAGGLALWIDFSESD